MSFRLKTIIGVALIEGCLLLILVWSSVNYLSESNEKELTLRAQSSAESIANLTRDAVLATDLARLDSVTRTHSGVPGDRLCAHQGRRPRAVRGRRRRGAGKAFRAGRESPRCARWGFRRGCRLSPRATISSVVSSSASRWRVPMQVIADARRHLSGIAVAEMVLVALFSALLGAYLTSGPARAGAGLARDKRRRTRHLCRRQG